MDRLRVTLLHRGEFSISVNVSSLADGKEWVTTTVYGPQATVDKIRFLEELENLGNQIDIPWILNGDFNLVCDGTKRSSGRANRRMASKFRHTINRLGLHDMPLPGRCFTWCNQQMNSVMAKLDRFLFNNGWEETFPISHITPLSSSISDHCPILLSCSYARSSIRRFRFENFWCRMEGFQETVAAAWAGDHTIFDPITKMCKKLQITAMVLGSWGQRKQNQMQLLFIVANKVIIRLDQVQEKRALSKEERRLRAFLKGKFLALASLERVRLRQREQVRDLREGDANPSTFT